MTRAEFVKGHKSDYTTIQTIYNRMRQREMQYLQSARWKVGQLVILTMDTKMSTRSKIPAIVTGINLDRFKNIVYHFKEANRSGKISAKTLNTHILNDAIISVNEISISEVNKYIEEVANEPEDVQCPSILRKLTKFNFKNLDVKERFLDKRAEDI